MCGKALPVYLSIGHSFWLHPLQTKSRAEFENGWVLPIPTRYIVVTDRNRTTNREHADENNIGVEAGIGSRRWQRIDVERRGRINSKIECVDYQGSWFSSPHVTILPYTSPCCNVGPSSILVALTINTSQLARTLLMRDPKCPEAQRDLNIFHSGNTYCSQGCIALGYIKGPIEWVSVTHFSELFPSITFTFLHGMLECEIFRNCKANS